MTEKTVLLRCVEIRKEQPNNSLTILLYMLKQMSLSYSYGCEQVFVPH